MQKEYFSQWYYMYVYTHVHTRITIDTEMFIVYNKQSNIIKDGY